MEKNIRKAGDTDAQTGYELCVEYRESHRPVFSAEAFPDSAGYECH